MLKGDARWQAKESGEKEMKRLASFVCVLLLCGCANPSIVNVNPANRSVGSITKVYVPRFEGSPEFVEESTDIFVAQLQSRSSAEIMQGDALRAESPDVFAGGNLAPTDAAIRQAKRYGAQVVVMGKVSSYDSHGTLNGFASVRVVDVGSRRIIATIHRPSGLLIGNVHQAVLAAVKRTANDVAKAIK